MMIVLATTIVPLINNFSLGHLNSNRNTFSEDVHLASYNVRLFNKYRWIHDLENTQQPTISYFQSKDVDVLCLQEVPKISSRSKLVSKVFPYSIQSEAFPYLRTLSKHPISYIKNISMPGKSTSALSVTLDIDGKALQVINIHLESIQSIENTLTHKYTRAEFLYDTIYPKLLSQISTDIPTVLCGDFNITPNSHLYKLLDDRFEDAFFSSTAQYGATYFLAPIHIPVRIDYIWGNSQVKFTQFHTHSIPYSDHLPISTRIHL